jgi:hypothetical protein
MLDLNNLPTNQKVDRQIFYANSPSFGANYTEWNKPRGATFVHIFAIAAGGGGGGGRTGTAGNAAGGGGGGSGAQASMFFLADDVPDVLYICVPFGGVGGAVNTAGSAGSTIFVMLYPDAPLGTSQHAFLRLNGGGAGGAGTTTSGGAAGNAGATIQVSGFQALASNGAFLTTTNGNVGLAGQAGLAGSSNVAPISNSVVFPATGAIASGGAGGGGFAPSGFSLDPGCAGGAQTYPTPAVPNWFTTSSGFTAVNGFQVFPNMPLFFGGGGGYGSGTDSNGVGGPGGPGAPGAYGAGGGGGGGGTTGSTDGRGGDGGPGLCIITTY